MCNNTFGFTRYWIKIKISGVIRGIFTDLKYQYQTGNANTGQNLIQYWMGKKT